MQSIELYSETNIWLNFKLILFLSLSSLLCATMQRILHWANISAVTIQACLSEDNFYRLQLLYSDWDCMRLSKGENCPLGELSGQEFYFVFFWLEAHITLKLIKLLQVSKEFLKFCSCQLGVTTIFLSHDHLHLSLPISLKKSDCLPLSIGC